MRSTFILVFFAVICLFVVTQADEGVQMNPSMILLEKEVHFSAPDGSDLVAAAGEYWVEPAAKTQLTLVPVGKEGESASAITIGAVSTEHEETLSGQLALSFSDGEDEHHVVLLQPNGRGLDAKGSYSGIRSRVIKRLSPTTIKQQVAIKPNYVTSEAPTTTIAKLDEATVLEEKITPPSVINSKVDLSLSVKSTASSTVGWWYPEITVRNNGSDGASFNHDALIIAWSETPCATAGSRSRTVVYGPPGGLYIPPQGVWSRDAQAWNFESTKKVIYYCLDPDNKVIESDETNNRFQLSIPPLESHPKYTPPSPEPKPDLVITSVEVVPSTGPPTTEFVVNVTVSNIGDKELPATSGARISSGIGGTGTLTTSLPVGIEKTIAIPIGHLLPSGTKTASAKVDYSEAVDEIDEKNNEMSYTFVVTEDTKRQKLQVIPPKKKKF